MATKTTSDAAPEQAQAAAVQTPAHGGSYVLDDATGSLTLIERTTQPNGRADKATPTTKE